MTLQTGYMGTAPELPPAPLGRSPPRNVWTSRMISPRLSNPASWKAWKVVVDKSGFEATNTWPPGTSARAAAEASAPKKSWRSAVSRCDRTVKRGNGRRREPPHAAAPGPQLGVVPGFVFDEAVRRVRDHGVDGVFGEFVEPPDGVRKRVGRPVREMRPPSRAAAPHLPPRLVDRGAERPLPGRRPEFGRDAAIGVRSGFRAGHRRRASRQPALEQPFPDTPGAFLQTRR